MGSDPSKMQDTKKKVPSDRSTKIFKITEERNRKHAEVVRKKENGGQNLREKTAIEATKTQPTSSREKSNITLLADSAHGAPFFREDTA